MRERLQQQTVGIADLSQKVLKARQALVAYKHDLQNKHTAHATSLLNEIALIEQHSDSQLLHEHLSPFHYPLTVSDFVKQASQYQLQYLSDAYLSNDSGDFIYTQDQDWVTDLQKIDELENRRFRCTLLCHEQVGLKKPVTQHNFKMSFPEEDVVIVPEKPRVCPLVRYQAAQSVVTNHRHENIFLTPEAEILIPYLDGSHDKFTLTSILISQVEQGELVLVDSKGEEITDHQACFEQATRICEDTLTLMAKKALFERY